MYKIKYFDIKCVICNDDVEIVAGKLGINGVELTLSCKNKGCRNKQTLIKIFKERKKPNLISLSTTKLKINVQI